MARRKKSAAQFAPPRVATSIARVCPYQYSADRRARVAAEGIISCTRDEYIGVAHPALAFAACHVRRRYVIGSGEFVFAAALNWF